MPQVRKDQNHMLASQSVPSSKLRMIKNKACVNSWIRNSR